MVAESERLSIGAAHCPLRVAVVTNLIPGYRRDLYRRLVADPRLDLHVFCQHSVPGLNLVTANGQFPGNVSEVPFWSLERDRLGWQWLPLRRLLAFHVIFIQGNPRILSNVALSFLLKGLGKSVVIWGQAHTGGGARVTEHLRLLWWRAFPRLFVYNDFEVAYLQSRGFSGHRIVGMNNGLDQEEIERAASAWGPSALMHWQRTQGLAGRPIVLSVARLDRKNRFDLFLEALPELLTVIPELLWCVIGDGPERDSLERRTRELGLIGGVRWLGAIYREDELAPWFLTARCLVHPGAIGLSLLHAFGYGLPVVTHNRLEGHMPEIHALIDGRNGLLYRDGDRRDLIEKVKTLVGRKPDGFDFGAEAKSTARERFNTRIMAERFCAIALEAAPTGCDPLIRR